MPSLVALNGPVAMKLYQDGSCYPKDQIIEVEALRYLYLQEAIANRHITINNPSKNLQILVLGDYSPNITHH